MKTSFPPSTETPLHSEGEFNGATPSLWRRMACWIYEGVLLFGVVFMASLVFTVMAYGVKSLLASFTGHTQSNTAEPASVVDLSSVNAASSALPSSLERELLQLFILSMLAAYFVYFWRKGQTLAMKTWGLELTTLEGYRLSTQQALQRLALSWIWFWPPLVLLIPFEVSWLERCGFAMLWVSVWAVLSLFHPRKQFWHDDWARTQLVLAPERSDRSKDLV